MSDFVSSLLYLAAGFIICDFLILKTSRYTTGFWLNFLFLQVLGLFAMLVSNPPYRLPWFVSYYAKDFLATSFASIVFSTALFFVDKVSKLFLGSKDEWRDNILATKVMALFAFFLCVRYEMFQLGISDEHGRVIGDYLDIAMYSSGLLLTTKLLANIERELLAL